MGIQLGCRLGRRLWGPYRGTHIDRMFQPARPRPLQLCLFRISRPGKVQPPFPGKMHPLATVGIRTKSAQTSVVVQHEDGREESQAMGTKKPFSLCSHNAHGGAWWSVCMAR